ALGAPLVKIYEADYIEIPLTADGPSRYAPADLTRKIKQLRKEMKQASGKLEFERAAELRDKIRELELRELQLRDGGLSAVQEL
ncbi:MAG TPA: UvrB/UvrC motif-containing protein, partial [Gammaproteobacteria bacterium]|nr:UvrB/UvrC motif-containing protein [Gammaproteobacteria bacterium]